MTRRETPVSNGVMLAPARMQTLLSKSSVASYFSCLEATVTRSNNLPSGTDLRVFRAIDPTIRKGSTDVSKRLLSAMRQISSRYAVTLKNASDSESSSSSEDSQSSLSPRPSTFEGMWEATEEALDHFNNALDAARGVQNAAAPARGGLCPQDARKLGIVPATRNTPVCVDMQKPQVNFPDYPVDNSDAPFVPPYQTSSAPDRTVDTGIVPKQDILVQSYLQDLYKANSSTDNDLRHPYEDEINAAVEMMGERPFSHDDITVYPAVSDTAFTFITTEEALFDAVERLKCVHEIAVDLENHSVRSFQGFVCLIQLSTRREDFVIDALALRGSINRALAPLFSDETIVKVLHGANKDIEWLERDFGIYVVNMFDTGQASRLLQFQAYSLSHLLGRFCSLHSSQTSQKKKFQLADWRVRPLPADMLAYARDDTHYLLYIYDRLRDELSKAGLLTKAWERSGAICRRRHEKMRYNAGMARQLTARHGLGFDPQQIRLLDALCKWRDVTAREEDESLSYVSPLSALFGIVHARDKARTLRGLMTDGFPHGAVPPTVEKHGEHIVQLVCDALDANVEENITASAKTVVADAVKESSVVVDVGKAVEEKIHNEAGAQEENVFGAAESDQAVDRDSDSGEEEEDGEGETTCAVHELRDGEIEEGQCDIESITNEVDKAGEGGGDAEIDNSNKLAIEVATNAESEGGTDLKAVDLKDAQEECGQAEELATIVVPAVATERDPSGMALNGGDSDRKRKRDEGKQKDHEEDVIEFFDYRKAKREDAEVKQVNTVQFDPLQKLKRDWREDKKRVRKRKKGTGRSLTYRNSLG